MRNEKRLINLLTKLVKLLNDESDRNPAFASELDGLLCSNCKHISTPKSAQNRSRCSESSGYLSRILQSRTIRSLAFGFVSFLSKSSEG